MPSAVILTRRLSIGLCDKAIKGTASLDFSWVADPSSRTVLDVLSSMVASLMRHGADPSIRDAEGSAALHIAAQFSFWPIVAFLSKELFSSKIYNTF